MKIKSKLRWGFGFLFIVMMAFGGLGIYFVNSVAKSSGLILKDNYESLNYVRIMQEILQNQEVPLKGQALNTFQKNLRAECKNVTEPGEDRAVRSLAANAEIMNHPASAYAARANALQQVQKHLLKIQSLNLQAIARKNSDAQHTVNAAITYLGLIGSFILLILFSFIINFPSYIANPLKYFAEAFGQIARKNYQQRLYLNSNDEFAALAASFNDMAGRLDEWENSNLASIKSEKLRIEAIIEDMPDPIIGVDEAEDILFVNRAAKQVLNLGPGDARGENAAGIAKNNDLMARILNSGDDEKILKVFTEGKESFFSLENREIDVPIGEMVSKGANQGKISLSAGRVYILRNITEFKELDQAKTNFIATISHELKTPISSIKMSVKLLMDPRVGMLSEEQRELAAHVSEDTDRLLKITGELLDLSQLETGNIQLNLTPVAPLDIVKYAIDAMQVQARQKDVTLRLISRKILPAIDADIEKTTWVLINFLSNALRYSPEHSEIILQLQDKSTEVIFSVRDSGKGIDDQYIGRLFERYFQVPADGQNKSGSGLGLAISKDFIEAQNGRIWVESAIGEGSRFSFSVPVTAMPSR